MGRSGTLPKRRRRLSASDGIQIWPGRPGRRLPKGKPKGRNVAAQITNEAAAAETITRLGAPRTITSGDRHLDVGMMRRADEAIQPAHGAGAAGIRQTARAGVLAGEDVIAEFRRFAGR
ncbi:hypothetical protein [Microbacterium aerolatum]|uniref:Uncharacterized protein n=1 Tax=Microbacterium aerolatum TaxID=153731 RepID=A0A511AAH2_9MICO|nr:hypothetical protein [Microbacterium aerolatum]GEK85184.1 hypothetical protein MAE01_03600 [Microbacterium aerolatum]GGB28864.1 hypothetical protein GCM10007198_19210 [Microbacterium aerolatum]